MKLDRVVEEYITLKTSLGMRFKSQTVHLKAFSRAMGEIDIGEASPAAMLVHLNGTGPVTTFWHEKFKLLKGFYRFAIGRGYAASCPLPTVIPKRPEPAPLHIYSTEQLRRLLAATATVADYSLVDPATYRTLLLLLYGTGLRISEALSLNLDDVDFQETVLTVRASKFFKTRLVPIGPRLAAALSVYSKRRRHPLCSTGNDSSFFVNIRGMPLRRQCAEKIFQKLRDHAGIRRQDGGRAPPRLHDIRATFAVHRLMAWYRDGVDVQRLLPRLATYLGHVNVSGTQRYLSMTPGLLQEANRRFECYVSLEANHV